MRSKDDTINSISKKQEDELLQDHTKKLTLSCFHCNYTTYRKSFLVNHLDTHSREKKIFSCKNRTYKTYSKKRLALHIQVHPEKNDVKPMPKRRNTASCKFKNCTRCSASFTSKQMLDNHVLRSHPELIEFITSKIHHCASCSYKTTIKTGLHRHMSVHPDVRSNYTSKTARSKVIHCKHCNAVYKSKQIIDDHVLKKHPEFIASVKSKIHECGLCTYKTTIKLELDRHMLKHPETESGYKHKFKSSACLHCEKSFTSKATMDDHIIRKHPEFMESVTSKVHECKVCLFKTTNKRQFELHTLRHPDSYSSYKPSTCPHCNAEFNTKRGLENHILNNHPKSIASITSKIHECKICTFKTTLKCDLDAHMMEHSGEKYTCSHCSAAFKSKRWLDDHVLKKHPKFSKLVTRKIHECEVCMYKAINKSNLKRHMLKHS